MKKLLAKIPLFVYIFVIWISTILVVGYLSIRFLPFSPTFPYYSDIAHYGRDLASFAHFDGIHYLRLVKNGYDDMGSQAFFPVYPLLVRMLSLGVFDPLYTSIALNISLIFATLYLISLRISKSNMTKFTFLFLSLPTSYYLIANYTESLFIFLVALFFHLTSQKKYLYAAIVAGIASGTRVVGLFLGLALLVELIQFYKSHKSTISKYFFGYAALLILVSVSGILIYSSYLYFRYSDPLKFVHVMSMFGVGRSTGEIILLPQLLFRYFRILTTSPITSIIGLRALWEIVTLTLVSLWLYLARGKLTLSSMVFCVSAIVFPTLSGTLSSFPRYAIVALPLYVSIANKMDNNHVKIFTFAQYLFLIVAVIMFVGGIFVA